MVHRSIISSTILQVVLSTALQAQTLKPFEEQYPVFKRVDRFENYSSADGLSSNGCRSNLLVDRQGFLWIGTANGLNKFDGNRFEVFTSNPSDATTLSGNTIRVLFEDQRGDIWVGTHSTGLNRFSKHEKVFHRYFHHPTDTNSLSDNSITAIHEDRVGNLWIGTSNGLNRLNASSRLSSSNRFVRYTFDPGNPRSLGNRIVTWITEDSSHSLLIGVSDDLRTGEIRVDRYDPAIDSFVHLRTEPRIPAELQPKKPRRVLQDTKGNLWITTEHEFYHYDGSSGILSRVWRQSTEQNGPLPSHQPFEDSRGLIWFIHWDGIISIDRDSRKVEEYENRSGWHPHGIEDRAGNLWFATDHGIDKLTRNAMQFKYLFPGGDVEKRFSLHVEDGAGMLWGGRSVYSWTLVRILPNQRVEGRAMASWEMHDPIGSIVEWDDTLLWVGTMGAGLGEVNKRTGKVRYFRMKPESIDRVNENQVLALCKDASTLWVGTLGSGVYEFDIRTRTYVKNHTHDPSNPTSISSNVIYSLIRDRRGSIWIGTEGGGLSRFDFLTGQFERWLHNPGDTSTISGTTVLDLYEDSHGHIWAATDNGVNKFTPKTGTFRRFLRRSGASEFAESITEDHQGAMWIAYKNRDIARLDTRTGAFRTYTTKSGLPQTGKYLLYAWGRRRTGEMVFRSDGVLVFHPDSLQENTTPPPVVFTGFSVSNRPVRLSLTSSGAYAPLIFPHDSNFFSIQFAALDFTEPGKNQHRYKLEGYDDDWVQAGTKREAHYTKVPPGEYEFRVMGSNNDGVWNEHGASISLIITPPWWKTTWAYLGYILLAGMVFYGARRYDMNRHRLLIETEHLKEVDHLKSRFFANISHEFRTPLTLILGPIHKWREKAASDLPDGLLRDLDLMERNGRRLLLLINQLLDLSKLEGGAMNLHASRRDIVAFVKGIAFSFESSAGLRQIGVSVETDRDELEAYFDRDKMEKILTNLLSNAFKFTPEGGSVTVRVQISNSLLHPVRASWRADGSRNHVEISVSDTGIGIPPEELPRVFDRFYQVDSSHTREQEGTGIGLALTKELVELHHGSISVRSDMGKGTEFTVVLPLGRKHLKDEEITEEPAAGDTPLVMYDVATTSIPGRAAGHQRAEGSSDAQKPIVLMVEDNPDVRAYMKEYLVSEYNVLECHDGAEGIEKARETIPDLIISDVMMPKLDGYTLCRTLKLDERTSHVPIILLTAKAGQEDKVGGLEIGADDYLTKPFDARELQARARNLIELRRTLRERFSVGQVLKPGEIAVTSVDDAFLKKAIAVVEQRMGDEKFGVEEMRSELGMSRTQLHRKLTALTNQSAGDFIRYTRLHRAKDLLNKDAGTVSEIAYQVGFNSVAYFTKCFREQFGTVPSDARVRKSKETPMHS